MSEPKYTRAEQKARMKQFDLMAAIARDAWMEGEAYVLLSFREYSKLIDKRAKRRRACSGSSS